MKLSRKIRVFVSELRLYICNEWISSLPSHSLRIFYYRKVMGFKLGAGSSILMHCKFDTAGNLKIGANSVINQSCRMDNRGGLFIGNNVSVSQGVHLLSADHDPESPGFLGREYPVTVSDYVWIGTRALILPGANLGEGCVVAAGSVVTKDVDDYTIVAGTPARFIKNRNRNLNYTISYKRLFQ